MHAVIPLRFALTCTSVCSWYIIIMVAQYKRWSSWRAFVLTIWILYRYCKSNYSGTWICYWCYIGALYCMRTLIRYSRINYMDQCITIYVLHVYTKDMCSILVVITWQSNSPISQLTVRAMNSRVCGQCLYTLYIMFIDVCIINSLVYNSRHSFWVIL